MYDVLAYLYILSRTQKCIHVAPPRWSTGVKHFVLLLEQGWKGALVGPASPNVTRVAEQRIVLNFCQMQGWQMLSRSPASHFRGVRMHLR